MVIVPSHSRLASYADGKPPAEVGYSHAPAKRDRKSFGHPHVVGHHPATIDRAQKTLTIEDHTGGLVGGAALASRDRRGRRPEEDQRLEVYRAFRLLFRRGFAIGNILPIAVHVLHGGSFRPGIEVCANSNVFLLV